MSVAGRLAAARPCRVARPHRKPRARDGTAQTGLRAESVSTAERRVRDRANRGYGGQSIEVATLPARRPFEIPRLASFGSAGSVDGCDGFLTMQKQSSWCRLSLAASVAQHRGSAASPGSCTLSRVAEVVRVGQRSDRRPLCVARRGRRFRADLRRSRPGRPCPSSPFL